MRGKFLALSVVGVAFLCSASVQGQVVFYDDSCDKPSLGFSPTTQTFVAPQDGFITTIAAGVGLFGTPHAYDLTITADVRSDTWPGLLFSGRCCYDPCVPGNNMAAAALPVPFQVFQGELVSVTFNGTGGDRHYDSGTSTLRMYVTGIGCMQNTGLVGGEWRMLSLPCATVDSVNNLLGDDGLGVYGADWAVVEWDEVAGAYQQLVPADLLVQGSGYWIKVLSGNPIVSIEGDATPPLDFWIPLMPDAGPGRWNMVGNPFDFLVPWGSVRVFDTITTFEYPLSDVASGGYIENRTAYVWNGSSYQSYHPVANPGSLNLFDGFWVRVIGNPSELIIPAARGLTVGDQEPAEGEWSLQLTVASGNHVDPGNRLGALRGARHGHDEYDLRELAPFAAPYLTLVFDHPEWGEDAWAYTTDFRSVRSSIADTWSFEVRSDVARTITLSWQHGNDGEKALERSVLIDVENRRKIRPAPGGRYTVEMCGPSHRFQWRVRNP